MTMFTFLLFSNSYFSGVSVIMAGFLFLLFVAVAFRGAAFGYGHRSSGVYNDSGDPLWVDAAGDH